MEKQQKAGNAMADQVTIEMITSRIGYFPGSVNVGLILGESGAILIDSGLDTQTAKRLKRGLEQIGQPLVAIIQTHAHADHFGGNAHLLTVFPQALVYAPPLEEAIIRYPVLEPIYLGMGATPVKELRNKFLEAPASRVDRLLPEEGELQVDGVTITVLPLPGHSWQQVGIVCEQICFAADSFFGEETLSKHKLPFLVDVHDTLQSLQLLQATVYAGYLPGHGSFVTSPDAVIGKNIELHQQIISRIKALLRREQNMEELLAALAEELELNIATMSSYALYRTALMGYLTGLLREEQIAYRFDRNQLLWKAL
ncbi:MBL fold metallo-hydrolase [Brevibacillus fulvus]|uniref:Glyoxylase-like metal-dependent hydrolase (Beta-lactamase superfamily II) n=1 Tax=Brevibacillus fulvus TaxID=1125967 RepID=A0A938Y3I1_9BACL|nr:MBL fold metallo-hydrolase [Brevibacillus fulvus]MBM7590937.1 glyoxylase-like metal-dependent hydrolase (beta-lactamase superfamily II) [Brevibacillus fulvus]